MRKWIAVALFLLACLSGFSQEQIREEVSVKWWIVPLFAVDAQGNPVADLKKEELRFEVNQRLCAEFILVPRSFQVSERPAPSQALPVPEKKKHVFFLFDVAFSSQENLDKSLAIARNIVEHSGELTAFSIFTLDPYAGLVYRGGPLEQKSEILALLVEKISLSPKARDIKRIWEMTNMTLDQGGRKISKYEGESEEAFVESIYGSPLKTINQNYFRSLDTLALAMNSVQDNKFAYFFSEGLPLYSREVAPHQESEFQMLVRRSADFLGHSGAVLFIVNPAGADTPSWSAGSGEDTLRTLAQESGGKYFEGEKENIASKIQNMHQAYYEIAFPDPGDSGSRVRQIRVEAVRPGVRLHTIRSLEESRPYSELDDIEKDIFAFNLITRNPFFMKRMTLRDMLIQRNYQQERKNAWVIVLPDDWLGKELDLYKAWIDLASGNTEIEKNKWFPDQAEQTVWVDLKESGTSTFIVINPKANAALLPGGGGEARDISPAAGKAPEIMPMAKEFVVNPELGAILAGVASYCDRLKQAGFHYFCTEKIVETLRSLDVGPADDISNVTDEEVENRGFKLPQGSGGASRSIVNKLAFDYQLIKDGNEVREQRKLLSSNKAHDGEKSSLATMHAFLSEKAVFAPVTLFARERQPFYVYRFIKHEKVKGVPCVVIEALPRDPADALYVYGQAWIDPTDHSVAMIKANPRSIVGYEKLLAFAKEFAAKLSLSLEINFDQAHEGIRFPSRIVLRELYKGGRFVQSGGNWWEKQRRIVRMKPEGWERNRTEYMYKDYRFFEVGVAVTEQ